jgi:enoyl-[acyl-carrier-protein] reductase (NADH)
VSLDTVLAEMREDSSLRAFTTPEQIAWAVITRLAPEASALTGSTLMLDAGRRRGLP